jgi:hypothetical protein
MTLRHFSEWWLIGSNANASWHYYLADVTNQYVLEALGGGLVTLVLFILILAYSFRGAGHVVVASDSNPNLKLLAWSLGAVLFLHVVSFVSVSYFDQNVITYYLVLAAIPALGTQGQPAPPDDESSVDEFEQILDPQRVEIF